MRIENDRSQPNTSSDHETGQRERSQRGWKRSSQPPVSERLLKSREVAELLSVHYRTFLEKRRDGRLPGFPAALDTPVGHRYRL